MAKSVLYIGSLVDDTVTEFYDVENYSIAGNNKTKNVIESLQRNNMDAVVLSPLFLNKTDFSYYPGHRIRNKKYDIDVYVPPHVGVFGLNYLTIVVMSVVYAFVLSRRISPKITIFYNYRLQRMLPGLVGSFFSTLILQYEDARLHLRKRGKVGGDESIWIRVLRGIEEAVKPLVDQRVQGAICTNTNLADIAPTTNTAIVRGVPSVGYPNEMPNPSEETDDIVVMFSSKLDEARGIDRFLEAVERINRDDVQFWISGYGSQMDTVRERVNDLDDQRVEFFGTLPWDEYRQRLVDSDVLVNFQDPHRPDSKYVFPSKLLDFMAAQSVIVSTDMSDIADCFSDTVQVAPVDRELHTLEEVVVELARQTDVYEEAVGRAADWIETQTPERSAQKINQVYENA